MSQRQCRYRGNAGRTVRDSPIGVVARLRTENVAQKVENGKLRSQLAIFMGFADTYLFGLNIIKDELRNTIQRNVPIVAKLQQIIIRNNKSIANLTSGRTKGADRNKSRAARVREEWIDEATRLRSEHPRWSLQDVAEHIRDRTPHGRKSSGRAYSARTIRDEISGVR